MSGGSFEYKQHYMNDIIERIEDYLYGHECDEDDVEYAKQHKDWYEPEELSYILERKHTLPNRYCYTQETVKCMEDGLLALKKAYAYAQRIDYLFEGDDSEHTFHRRLKADLAKIHDGKIYDDNV